MKVLADILDGVKVLELVGNKSVKINAIHFDSRKVIGGDVFIAVKGTQVDGHKFISSTIENGASAIICEVLPSEVNDKVVYVKVEDSSEALGMMASNYYDNPSSKLNLVGITGTNGKTTIATLLYRLFIGLGYKVGLLSTVRNYINDKVIDATHTTPDAIQLNKLLNDMAEEGCGYCFMEVSSHAIIQNRIAGLDFRGGIFTNITHDHLDFHKTFDEYIRAKKLFFDNLSAQSFALTNADDRNGKVMLQNTKAQKQTYALKSFADFKCKVLESHFDGMMLRVEGFDVWTRFIGNFNAYNLLAVYGTAILLDQQKDEVLTVISTLESVEGRFEYFRSESGLTGIVDYAHTPDALINVLKTINDIRTGNEKVITVVGAGGDRDKTKRPIMAKVAAEMSDRVILTSDNPRTEIPDEIIKDMQAGIEADKKRKVLAIADRREAIKTACLLANQGDIILVAGKGHETYQEVNGVKNHFDDKEELLENFKEL